MKFTKAQEEAINAQNSTLLISAGAGSGKTSVLTERIIQKICGEHNITDFLVVTFTRASANDLKNKIARAINNKLAENMGNIHLKRQLILLSRANISTMHAFCLDLIKSNYVSLGIPQKFRMLDENEADIIRRSVLDKTLEDYYNAESPVYDDKSFTYADFLLALESFINSRDDENIYSVIFKIYDKLMNRADPWAIFDEQIELMRKVSDDDSAFVAKIRDNFAENISYSLDTLYKSLEIIWKENGKIEKKYEGAFLGLRQFFESFRSILNTDGNYTQIHELCANYENVRIGSHKLTEDYEIQLKPILDARHKTLKEEIASICKIFEHDTQDLQRFAQSYERIFAVMKDFIGAFQERLLEEKIHLKSFDFIDLERFAFKLLVKQISDDGEIIPTELAVRLRSNYAEIYIDEYQDTNKIQDMIFKALSTETADCDNGNRFMVGDIKQSIYSFRGAAPYLFAGYSRAFEQSPDIGKPRKIYLQENFRSTQGVIDFINHIFANLFSEELGGVDYSGGEVLTVGKKSEENNDNNSDVIFAIVEKSSKDNEGDDSDDVALNSDIADGFANDIGEVLNVKDTEAIYTALTVKNLLENGKLKSGEPIMPGDIAVLMRDYTHVEEFVKAFKKYDIPCYTDRSKGFLNSAEILLITSLLRIIDNPARDIDLAGVLKSPVFNFSLDDLIYIKPLSEESGAYSTLPLFSYVKTYAERGDLPELQRKCEDFLETLSIWRAKSRILPVDKFIWYIYRQIDIMNKISRETMAAERKANLNLLYEYARKFEANAFRGLYEFLNYIDDIETHNGDFERAKVVSENSVAVRIMSVHKSKGLEFPVCILAKCGQMFSNKDYTQSLIVSEEQLYFDLKYKDEIGYEKTPFKKLCAEKIKKNSRSEEVRILYVALTRAIEKLIIVGGVNNIDSFLAKNSPSIPQVFTDEYNSSLKWMSAILLNTDGSNKTKVKFDVDLITNYDLKNMAQEIYESNTIAEITESDGEWTLSAPVIYDSDELQQIAKYENQIERMYNFEYQYNELSQIPVKIAVTDLTRELMRNSTNEYELSRFNGLNELEMTPLPRFLEDESGESSTLSPALRGTATHLFMQFADFEYSEIFGSVNEAANLLSRKFLTEAQYERINFDRIDKFFATELYARIKNSQKVYREVPFLLRVPVSSDILSAMPSIKDNASVNTAVISENEYVLIQGAIDLFFEDTDGKIYIVDFKTDYVTSADVLVERHKSQLDYYCMAASEISGKPIGAAYIYSFTLGRAVKII